MSLYPKRSSATARSAKPFAELLRRLVGLEDLDEAEAGTFFRDALDHRRKLTSALGRPVHLRVAALDLLTMQPMKSGARHDSHHPIIVTSSLLEKAFEVATADGVTGLCAACALHERASPTNSRCCSSARRRPRLTPRFAACANVSRRSPSRSGPRSRPASC